MLKSPHWLLMGILVAVLAAGMVLWNSFRKRTPLLSDAPLQTAFYVWQEVWTDEVRQAIDYATYKTDRWMVYTGEFRASDGQLIAEPKAPDWSTLAKTPHPLSAVIRLQPSVVPFTQNQQSQITASFIHNTISGWVSEIAQTGIHVEDIQLDYDCPTSKLQDYNHLVKALLDYNPTWSYSITALPDWLNSKAFPELVSPLPYYVLQVHSLEKPKTIQDRWAIFDSRKTEAYLQKALQIHTPFFLALPTYGYELQFDASGKFTALQADGSSDAWIPEGTVKKVMTDPFQMAAFIRDFKKRHPISCRGITWFRLPIGNERLNWPWVTLEAVMAGNDPKVSISAEIRAPEPYLLEVWIVNTGEWNPERRIRVPLEWAQQAIIAYDTINQFREDEKKDALIGPSPRIAEPLLAAWYRVAPTVSNPTETIQVGEVEVLP